MQVCPILKPLVLKRLNVGCLPTLRSLNYIELHRLTLLKTLEAARVDCGVMGENVFAVLTADEAKPLGIVKPLHCSLFHRVFLGFIYCQAQSNWVRATSLLTPNCSQARCSHILAPSMSRSLQGMTLGRHAASERSFLFIDGPAVQRRRCQSRAPRLLSARASWICGLSPRH